MRAMLFSRSRSVFGRSGRIGSREQRRRVYTRAGAGARGVRALSTGAQPRRAFVLGGASGDGMCRAFLPPHVPRILPTHRAALRNPSAAAPRPTPGPRLRSLVSPRYLPSGIFQRWNEPRRGARGHPTMANERPEHFDPDERAAQKRRSREADQRAVESGEKSAAQVNEENNLWSGLSFRRVHKPRARY
jgi:hypothetical protein